MISDKRERMRDAEFASNIDVNDWRRAVGGYLGGPRAARQWTVADWERFPHNRKLPIWVGGFSGHDEGAQAVRELRKLRVPRGCYTVLDLEMRVDRTYVEAYGKVLHDAGYKVFVYGSASTVFQNPHLNGYWVADYRGTGPFMYNHSHVRMTQYRSGDKYDGSSIKTWTYYFGKWWV